MTRFTQLLVATTLTAAAATAGAQTYIDSSQTINTDRRGVDFYVGLHANGVVLTVDTGAQINGGQYTSGIRTFGNSQVNVIGGSVVGIDTLTSSVVRVSGGAVGTLTDRTQVVVSGGSVSNLYLTNISNSNYSSVGSATVSGGTITQAESEYGAKLTFSGGVLSNYLTNAGVNTVATINGGSILGILYSMDGYNSYNIYGSGLAFTNPTPGKSMAAPNGPGTYLTGTYYDLNGVLSDGTPIATKFFSATNSTTQAHLFNTAPVPEPSSVLLMVAGLGLFGWLRRSQLAERR